MLMCVERGKGGRGRHALLSADLLALLRAWWQQGRREGVMRPGGWLFPGQDPAKPITTNHTTMTGPKKRPMKSLPRLCTRNSPIRIARVMGRM